MHVCGCAWQTRGTTQKQTNLWKVLMTFLVLAGCTVVIPFPFPTDDALACQVLHCTNSTLRQTRKKNCNSLMYNYDQHRAGDACRTCQAQARWAAMAPVSKKIGFRRNVYASLKHVGSGSGPYTPHQEHLPPPLTKKEHASIDCGDTPPTYT